MSTQAELDAFISYSRVDDTFVKGLTAELVALGRTPWIDTDAIPAGAPWRDELGTAIEAAVAFVFVVSPDSVKSRECLHELDRATALGKRLVPVILRRAELPPALARIQWITAHEGAEAAAAAQVSDAIHADYEWARTHTEWLARALRWEREGSASLLPRGDELRAAEAWLARAPEGHDPPPTPLQTRFVVAARARERQVRRRITVVSSSALVLIVAAAAVTLWQRQVAIEQSAQAESRMFAARASARVDDDPLASLALAVRSQQIKQTPESVAELRHALAESRLRRLLRGGRGAVEQLAISPDGLLIATGDETGKVWLWASGSDRPSRTLPGLSAKVRILTFRDRGKQLVGADENGAVRVWLTASGHALASWKADGQLKDAGTDARADALITATTDGVRVWQLPSGKLEQSLDTPTVAGRAALSPDGRRALTGEGSGEVRQWDVRRGTGELVGAHASPAVDVAYSPTVAFSPDGSLALSEGAAQVLIYAPDGKQTHELSATAAAFSPDSRWIVTGTGGDAFGSVAGFLEVHDTGSWERTVRMQSSGGPVAGIAFSPDGRLVASGSWHGDVQVWDREQGDTLAVLKAHHTIASDIAFAPDGRHVVTVGRDGASRVWDATGLTAIRPAGEPQQLVGAVFDRSGAHVLAASTVAWVTLSDSETGAAVDGPSRCLERYSVTCLEFGARNLSGDLWKAPWGRAHYEAAARESAAQLADPPTPEMVELGHRRSPYSADLNGAGTTVAIGTMAGTVTQLDVGTGAPVAPVAKLSGRVEAVRFSPDGRHLVAAAAREARIFDAGADRSGRRLAHPDDVTGVAFIDGGATVVTTAGDGVVRLWRTRDGKPVGSHRFEAGSLLGVASGPGGLIAVADGDVVTVWDAHGDEPTTVLRDQPPQVSVTALSADGAFVATGGSDPAVRVWERLTGRLVAILDGHGSSVRSIEFSPDGKRVLTASEDGIARVFDCDACASATAVMKLASQRVREQLKASERAAIVR